MIAAWMKSPHIINKTVNVLSTCEITLASYIHLCCFVYYHIIKKVVFVKVSFYLLGNFKDFSFTVYFPYICFGLRWSLLFWIIRLDYLHPNEQLQNRIKQFT